MGSVNLLFGPCPRAGQGQARNVAMHPAIGNRQMCIFKFHVSN